MCPPTTTYAHELPLILCDNSDLKKLSYYVHCSHSLEVNQKFGGQDMRCISRYVIQSSVINNMKHWLHAKLLL